MCDPISIAAGGLMVAGQINKFFQDKKDAADNKDAANNAFRSDVTALVTRVSEERLVAGLELEDVAKQGAALTATSAVGAVEAGVSGISADLIAGDIERQVADEQSIIGRSLLQTERQLGREIDSAASIRGSRIAGVPGPSTVGALIGVGAGVLRGFRSAEQRNLG